MTEFGSEEAMGRIREQGYDRVLKTQWDWEMGMVCVAWWNGAGLGGGRQRRKSWVLISGLPLAVCVFMGKSPNALELDTVFRG